jgi:thymidylate synthase (FAD)
MHTVDIKVFPIAQTRVNWPEIFKWLDHVGVKAPDSVWDQLAVGSDAEQLVALCGKRCYMSFEPKINPNVTKIREDLAAYLDNVLKSGHGSVLEHATWSFAIEGCSRVFTGEMNRHRAGVAVSEGSMRYIRFDDLAFWMPESLKQDGVNVGKNVATQHKLQEAFASTEKLYLDLCNIWQIEEMKDFSQKKKLTSLFRRIVGMGVATGGVWTINARALRHIITLRTTEHAEEEIQYVFDRIADHMVASAPLLFADFKRNTKGEWVPEYAKV